MMKYRHKLRTLNLEFRTIFVFFALVFSLIIVNFQLLIIPGVFAHHGSAHRIVCLGDSITVGYGPRFRTPQSETCTINAVQGRQTSVMLEEFNTTIRGQGFTDILILGGVNDIYIGRSITQIKNNLSAIYRGAKEGGMRVIGMTVNPTKTYTNRRNPDIHYRPEHQPLIDELDSWIMSNPDIDVKVDIYSTLEDPANPDATNPRYLSADTLHPNAAGYELIASTISERAFGGPPGDRPSSPPLYIGASREGSTPVVTSAPPTASTSANFAGGPVPLEAPFGGTTSISGAGGYIVNYSRIVFAFAGGIAGGLAMLMLIIAGIQIMTSSGEEQITQARARIQGALLGLALLSTGGLLLYLINPCFFSFEDAQVCTTRIASTGISTAPTTYVSTSISTSLSIDTSQLAGEIPVNPGRLIFPNGSAYQITREDVLWLGRMVEYEGGRSSAEHAAEILWVVAQRFYWLPAYRHGTFTRAARAFSQPINPIWQRDGDRCRPGGRYTNTEHCEPERLARRDEAVRRTWDSLSSITKRVTEAFVTGQLPNHIPGILNFDSNYGCDRGSGLIFVRNGYPGEGDCSTPRVNHLYAERRRDGVDSRTAGFERMRVEAPTGT